MLAEIQDAEMILKAIGTLTLDALNLICSLTLLSAAQMKKIMEHRFMFVGTLEEAEHNLVVRFFLAVYQ